MNAAFFGLAGLAALNPKLLILDLILATNRRPRQMFVCFLLGAIGLNLTIGLLDVEAADRLKLALGTIVAHRLGDYVFSLPAFAGAARLSVHQGDVKEAHRQLARAMRARPSATYLLPYLAVRLRLQLAQVYLAIAEPATASQLLREIDDILSHRPALGALIGEVDEFRRALASRATTGADGRLPLTPAELRLLPYLQTHLTARGIADRLLISRHTVETQVKSLYRKLGVSSRNDAVRRATAIGLLGD